MEIFNQIIDKIFIILSISLILQGLQESNFLEFLLSPLSKIKNIKIALIFWILFGAIISSFAVDLTAAAIVCPLVLYYCEQNNIEKNKELFLLFTTLGIATGGDLTKYGGGDNILLVGFFESYFNILLTNATWFYYITIPTIIILLLEIIIFPQFLSKENCSFIYCKDIAINYKASLFFSLALISLFLNTYTLSIILFIIGVYYLPSVKIENLFQKLPFKALIIWTSAFLIGKLIGFAITHFALFDFSKLNIWFICLILFILTGVCTQTLLTSCFSELIFSIPSFNYSILMLMIKSINANYLTILSDGCFPVMQSYGVKTRTLFKFGALLIPIQIFIPVLWYFILM